MKKNDLLKFWRKNGSKILTTVATIGVVATTGIAIVGTKKAIDKLEKKKEEKGEELTTKEKVVTVLPTAVAIGTSASVTVAAIIGCERHNAKINLELITANKCLMDTFKQYRTTVINEYGKEKDKEILDNIEPYKQYTDYHIQGLDTPDEKVMWYEPLTGQYWEAYEREIIDAEYHINRNFAAFGGLLTVRDYLDMLGLLQPEMNFDNWEYTNMGWNANNFDIYWIDFYHTRTGEDKNGVPVFTLTPLFDPEDLTEELL